MNVNIFNLGLKFSRCALKVFAQNTVSFFPGTRVLSSNSDNLVILKRYTSNEGKDYSVKTEKDAGMTEFIGDHEGFGGVLRHLYSDFIVNEISIDNTVVSLDNLDRCQNTTNSFNNLKKFLSQDDLEKVIKHLNGTETGESEISLNEFTDNQIEELLVTLKRYIFNLKCYIKKSDFGKVLVMESAIKKNMASNPTYTHFVLHKENIATQDAISVIARSSKSKKNVYQSAGIKDKRCISSQMVSAKNVRAEHLLPLNTSLRGIKIGGIFYACQPLRIGELSGNHFQIVVREVDIQQEQFDIAIKNVVERGFLNYFGLQRFGRTEVPTLLVGKHLLVRNFKSAVESILKPNNHKISADEMKCRQIWWDSQNAKEAIRHLIYKDNRIGILLKGLVEEENNYEKALCYLSRSVTDFYLHSYASYLWNRAASRRICELGQSPVVGDLLIHKPGTHLTRFIDEVRFVTQEMIDSGNVSITDVVLPVPGTEIILPQNDLRTIYGELLEEDGLSMNSFQSENKRFSIRGRYRPIIEKPQKTVWTFMNYDDSALPLNRSDFHELVGLSSSIPNVGDKRALRLEFSLPKSVYATSMLRELMKRCITEMDESVFKES